MSGLHSLALVMMVSLCLISKGTSASSSGQEGGPKAEVTSERDHHFNCERFGQSCSNDGRCNSSTGQCQCVDGFQGYSCMVNYNNSSSSNNTRPCSLNCENGGTCFSDSNNPDFCACSPDYTGSICQDKRVSVKCEGLYLDITFLPMDNFNGTVYLGNNNSDISCYINRTGDFFSGTFRKDLGVCNGLYEQDNQTGDETFTKQMTIQYNPDFLEVTDLVLNLSCRHPANHTVHSQGSINVLADEDKQAEGHVLERYEPAKLEILRHPNMSQLSSDVHLGQRVYMFNYLEEDTVFKNLIVEHCVVTDPDIQKYVTIIENGCPTQKAKKLFQQSADFFVRPDENDYQPGVRHDLKIFKLRESTVTLTFTCTVTMCKSRNESTCQLPDCSASSESRVRRDASSESRVRRDAGQEARLEADTKRQETKATIRIAADDNVSIITSKQAASTVTCADDPMVQTTIVTLAVLSVVLLLICLLLGVALYQRRRSSKFSEPVGHGFRLSQ